MNKTLIFIVFCFFIFSTFVLNPLQANDLIVENECCTPETPSTITCHHLFVEFKAGYFLPFDHFFRDIYSGGGGIVGGELSYRVYSKFYAWLTGDFFFEEGLSIGDQDDTEIYIVPIGLGLKYFFPYKCLDFYLGGGLLVTYLHMEDHSPFVIPRSSKWGAGGIAKAGLIMKLNQHVFIDLFTSYNYTRIHFHDTDGGRVVRHTADLSGLIFGGGIGFAF